MYSLLVNPRVQGHSGGTFEILRGRFLEHTSSRLTAQLSTLSLEAQNYIRSWPCLLMEEGSGEEVAYIGAIRTIQASAAGVRVTIDSVLYEPTILNATVWKVRSALQIEQFEFHRNHFAIKEANLFTSLAEAGHEIPDEIVRQFSGLPLPAPSRADLFRVRDVIAAWPHAKIDDLLLELGVSGLEAGRELGDGHDRANSVLRYCLDHPGATTAENSLLSALLARRTCDTAAAPTPSPDTTATNPLLIADADTPPPPQSRRVFVVHGRNEDARDRVVAFLSTAGLDPIVLHEQPNMGRHLLTKFMDEAELVTFAVVLLTDDDEGAARGEQTCARARQNVILELGYFLARLGQGRVCALKTPNVETPSDFDGIVYIPMTDEGRWEVELERELRAAKLLKGSVEP